jgi:predicted nucleic acid-binding protein
VKYYLDSCIWRDFLENRADNYRPLGDWALALIKKIIAEEGTFVISEIVIKELRSRFTRNQLNPIYAAIPNALILNTTHTTIQLIYARKLQLQRNIPLPDALHAVIARDCDAILITRDRHFVELQDIVEIKKPEDLL